MQSSSGMVHGYPGGPGLQWSPDKKHSDRERWICIYPAYINNKKTLAQGRKIAKERCVENPTHQEIRDVLVAAGLKVGVENKLYSRERSKEMLYRGRIRIQLKNDDGSLCNDSFPTRDSIMYHLGDMIPKLKSRQNKSSTEAPQQASTGSKGKGKGKGRR
ncbi:signal recognition particle 19 kDa protein [Diabrotica virgifera virgifera]|uniref:Signal recognition particle 19 kDa protein n=1 Tax=Diabrotica virgifera virgifera TaxID=50390 RepID=A0A6P7H278_DIAVI|nr:signal recognition particle 19 kDa protein [Diabrotica virgifera virgifera]